MHPHLSFGCFVPVEIMVSGKSTNVASIDVTGPDGFKAEAITVDNRAKFEELKPGTYTVIAQRLDIDGQPIGDAETQEITLADDQASFTLDIG